MTDEQIIKALECLTGEPKLCKDCPYNNTERYPFCREGCAKDALDLIKKQQAEIDRLIKDLKTQTDILKSGANGYEPCFEEDKIRAEAIKEFAEKLKQKISKPWYYLAQIVFVKEDIDELVRETVGKNDARNIIQR